MAEFLFGHVYFHGRFAGLLKQEPGDRCSFAYDEAYLDENNPGMLIAQTLPPRSEPHIFAGKLHPFFDNLLSEGRQAAVQARWLGVPIENRFARLLAFGGDCIGAITVRDPRPRVATGERPEAVEDLAAIASRASISGVQAKLLAVETEAGFRPAREGELSTHIAKLPGGNLHQVVALEHLSTQAARVLLPDDEIAETVLSPVAGIAGECLLIRRFDRVHEEGTIAKRHFEEFNQILGHLSEDKYVGSYGEMAQFMRGNPLCSLVDVERLFRRILTCVLLGNNDAHMKNFGLVYENERLHLAPFYDVLAAALYEEYSQSGMALQLGSGTNPRNLAGIGVVHLVALAQSFGLKKAALREAVHDIGRRLDEAQSAVHDATHGSRALKKKLADYMGKRWNGTFREIIGSTGRGL